MNRTEKTALIADVKGRFDRAISVTLLDFQGLTVETVTALRRAFKKNGVEYKVLKNTLIRHALKDSPYKVLVGDISPTRKNAAKAHAAVRGMTGVAWSYEDPAAAAKVVETFKKEQAEKAEKLKVKTGMVGGNLIAGDALARMPGLKETRAEILGMIMAPGAQLYATLLAPSIQIVAILADHGSHALVRGDATVSRNVNK
jgi:large subunit ribosomal protein L10